MLSDDIGEDLLGRADGRDEVLALDGRGLGTGLRVHVPVVGHDRLAQPSHEVRAVLAVVLQGTENRGTGRGSAFETMEGGEALGTQANGGQCFSTVSPDSRHCVQR